MLTSRRLLVALFFVSLFVLSARSVTDPDFGWHLRTGEYVVSTLSIPHFDFFSFTATGQPWVTHEWFAQVLMYCLYGLGGFGALTLFFALVSTVLFGVVYLRCQGQPYVAVFVVLLAALGAAPFWGPRPHTISLLLTSIFLYILDRYRRERRGKLLLWLIPPMLVWANSHGSFALGPVLIAVYLGADWIEKALWRFTAGRLNLLATPNISLAPFADETESDSALGSASDCHCEESRAERPRHHPPGQVGTSSSPKLDAQSPTWALGTPIASPRSHDSVSPPQPRATRDDRERSLLSRSTGALSRLLSLVQLVDRSLTAILIGCVATIVLNPNGARIYTYPFETLGSHAIQTYIQEWQPPDFASRAVQPFLVLLILTALALLVARPRVSLASLILLVAFTYASLRASRQISIWVLIAAPVLSASVTKLLHLRANGTAPVAPRRSFQALNWILLLLVLLAGAFRIVGVVQSQAEAELDYFPVKAVDTLVEKGWKGPIFNQYNWGGYLIWRLYPRERVFIDGRSDVYSLIDDFVVREYLKAYTASADWREPLDRYGIQLVMLEPDAPLIGQLAHDAGWKQVYADAQAVIYKRE